MNEILIYGPIGMGYGRTADELIREIGNADDDLLVRINSGGGSFDEGPAIYNILAAHKGRVETQVDGIAYSMAAVILQAGKVRRMAANSVLMVHGAQSWSTEGSAEDLRRQADVMDTHNQAMVRAFTARGIEEETVRAWLMDGEDHYFDADEAMAAGLVDEITEAIDMAAAVRQLPDDLPLPPALAAYRKPTETENTMSGTQTTETQASGVQAPNAAATGVDVQAFTDQRNKTIREGEKAGKKAERARQSAIRAFFDRPQFSDAERIGQDHVKLFADFRDRCLDDENCTLDAARNGALDIQDGLPAPILSADAQTQSPGSAFGESLARPPMAARSSGRVSAGEDVRDKFTAGVTDAMMIKAGLETDKEKLAAVHNNEFASMSTVEIARRYLDMHSLQPMGFRREQIIGSALVMANGITHGTSDFANILENVANKAMMMGWDEAPETWSQWARTGTLPDFKQGSRVNLSTFGDLDLVYENGEYKYGSFSDLKETLQLATYGKLFGISRQALANDDLSALSAIPRGMGRAAARKIGDLAYDVLTSNPTLNQDSTELFAAGHNNLGTGGAISVAPGGTLDEGWTAMGLQTDPSGTVLNITPRHLLVPKALEISATSTIADKTYADANAAQERMNPFQNRLTVTADSRLDASSATQWYLLADGTMHDTVEVAFLNGQQTPYLEAQDGWKVDGVEYKVRIDAVAAAMDFRTMFRNPGA